MSGKASIQGCRSESDLGEGVDLSVADGNGEGTGVNDRLGLGSMVSSGIGDSMSWCVGVGIGRRSYRGLTVTKGSSLSGAASNCRISLAFGELSLRLQGRLASNRQNPNIPETRRQNVAEERARESRAQPT
jgi:hypothetical protein